MSTGTGTGRLEIRIRTETKRLAEHAPAVLVHQASTTLSNAEFDRFVAACQGESPAPSQKIMEAAERLDREGFVIGETTTQGAAKRA